MPQFSDDVIIEQRRYALSARRKCSGLIVPEAFVRGIRHLGYRTNVEAIAELVDNSIQAYAENIHVVFGFDADGSSRKPTKLAIIDDGHGMHPEMMRFAMMWGGTHRENNRAGLGRFGYGLPCAAVSIGRKFTIFSSPVGGRLHCVTLDLDVISKCSSESNIEMIIPDAKPARLPRFVLDALKKAQSRGWRSGTVVIIENLDRLDWTTVVGLRRNLIRQFGVAYHKLLRATSIHVDGDQVRPIDPLFLDSDADLYDLDGDRAVALDPVTVQLEGDDSRVGKVTLRYAWLPPSFAATDKTRDAIGINANDRFPIIKQFNGVNFSRNGRLIDVQARTPWTVFINNDRYIRVEIEFSASLDEAFGVTTSKQQVSVSAHMWDRLRVAGLQKAIEHLRAKVRAAKGERQTRKPRALTSPSPRLSRADIAHLAGVPRGVAVSDALHILLEAIERRASDAKPALRAEYRDLMKDWSERLSRVDAGRS